MHTKIRLIASVILLIYSANTIASAQMMADMLFTQLDSPIESPATPCHGEPPKIAQEESSACCEASCSSCISNSANFSYELTSTIHHLAHSKLKHNIPSLTESYATNLYRPPILS